MAVRRTTRNGFARTGQLLAGQIRTASQGRGFAQSKLLTHWEDIAGDAIAAVARPVDISYGRNGLGATLTLLTTGAQAPMLEMQKEQLREKVNAVYGYHAITRIRITQTSAHGFADGQVQFAHRGPEAKPNETPDAKVVHSAQATAEGITDDSLRKALTRLGTHILTKETKGTRP